MLIIPGMDKHTIATQLVCAWLSRTEVDSGETAARETEDYIAWVYSSVVGRLEREKLQPMSSQRCAALSLLRG